MGCPCHMAYVREMTSSSLSYSQSREGPGNFYDRFSQVNEFSFVHFENPWKLDHTRFSARECKEAVVGQDICSLDNLKCRAAFSNGPDAPSKLSRPTRLKESQSDRTSRKSSVDLDFISQTPIAAAKSTWCASLAHPKFKVVG